MSNREVNPRGDLPKPLQLTLGGQRLEVVITMERLKRLLPVVVRIGERMRAGQYDEPLVDDFVEMVVVASGRPQAEIEALPVTVDELNGVLMAICKAAGIERLVQSFADGGDAAGRRGA